MLSKSARGRPTGGAQSPQERPKCGQSVPKNALGSQKGAQGSPKVRPGDQKGDKIEYIPRSDGENTILWKSLIFLSKTNDSEGLELQKSS